MSGGPSTEKRRFDTEEIRGRLPMLEVVAACGVVVRRAGAHSKCACPFHGERTPSMVIYEDHAHCFGCGWNGDIFAWWMASKGVDFVQAVRDLAGMAGVRAVEAWEAERWRASTRLPQRPPQRERVAPSLPELDRLTDAEMEGLAALRGLSVEGVRRAAAAEILWGCVHQGQRAWVLTDRSRRNAQFRRLDGRRWYGEVKAWTAAGSWAAWPVGCAGLGLAERVAVVEGGPDALAMCDLMAGWGWGLNDGAVVAMFGASASIAPWCLGKFRGRRVRIFAHNDPERVVVREGREVVVRPGSDGAERWRAQLATVARSVDVVMAPDGLALRDGGRVCDVNDVLIYERTNRQRVTGDWRW
jgi:hypothetical protein